MFGKAAAASLAMVAPQASVGVPAMEATSTTPIASSGPEAFAAACANWDDWDKPAPPFPIAPALYYVGACGISVLMLVTPDGLARLAEDRGK